MIFILSLSTAVYAADAGTESVEREGFLPSVSAHANWAFSGMVTNESGEQYGYFFQMQRRGNDFHVVSALLDAQTKALILMDEGDARLPEPERNNWHVGRSFLRFNAINNSWVFGLKTADKKGFNFKVDMLNQLEHNPVTQGLRAGLDVIVSQTGQLNGHIRTGVDGKEQFVAAKSAWFRQIWLSNQQTTSHQLNSILCRFNDGSGFYSMNMLEPDAVRGAVAGWFDAQGISSAMSQFINVKETSDGLWQINVSSPSLHLVLADAIKQPSVIAGFVTEHDQQGFCVLNKDAMGEPA